MSLVGVAGEADRGIWGARRFDKEVAQRAHLKLELDKHRVIQRRNEYKVRASACRGAAFTA